MAIETSRGVAKSEGVFHDAARKVMKCHKIHFVHGNHVKTQIFIKIRFSRRGNDRIRKMHETVGIPCSNWVKFKPRIPQNRLFAPKRTFPQKGDFGAKSTLWREKATSGCLFALFRPGASKHQFRLTF